MHLIEPEPSTGNFEQIARQVATDDFFEMECGSALPVTAVHGLSIVEDADTGHGASQLGGKPSDDLIGQWQSLVSSVVEANASTKSFGVIYIADRQRLSGYLLASLRDELLQ